MGLPNPYLADGRSRCEFWPWIQPNVKIWCAPRCGRVSWASPKKMSQQRIWPEQLGPGQRGNITPIIIWQSWFCYMPTGRHKSMIFLPPAPSWVASCAICPCPYHLTLGWHKNFGPRAKLLVPSAPLPPSCHSEGTKAWDKLHVPQDNVSNKLCPTFSSYKY